MTVGCDALRLILRTFTPVIKTNISSSSSVGVDISREERYVTVKYLLEVSLVYYAIRILITF